MAKPLEMLRSIARLSALVGANILSYFRSSDSAMFDDLTAATTTEVQCLMQNLAWINCTIAKAGFRLRRRATGSTPFRRVMQDDGLYGLLSTRVACMLGVALGEEAGGFAAGAANWDGPVAIGVCDICNVEKVWAN